MIQTEEYRGYVSVGQADAQRPVRVSLQRPDGYAANDHPFATLANAKRWIDTMEALDAIGAEG